MILTSRLGSFIVNNEPVLTRTLSRSTGSRLRSFREEIRRRDGGCVITGKQARGAYRDHWTGFEAAHVFPLAYESHWAQHNLGRWITVPAVNGGTINSRQNAVLLRSDIHQLFDSYDISINPDVIYGLRSALSEMFKNNSFFAGSLQNHLFFRWRRKPRRQLSP